MKTERSVPLRKVLTAILSTAVLVGAMVAPMSASAASPDGDIVLGVYDDLAPTGEWVNAGKLAKYAGYVDEDAQAALEANGNCVSYHCANYVHAVVTPELVSDGDFEQQVVNGKTYVRRAAD